MIVAIDSTPLKSAHSFRGVGSYTKNLISSLEKYEKNISYKLFIRGQKVPENADLVHYPYFDPFFLTLPVIKRIPTVVTVHDLTPLVFPDKFPAGTRGMLKWRLQKMSLSGARRVITDSDHSKKDIARITGYPSERIDAVHIAADPAIKRVEAARVIDKTLEKFGINGKFILYVGDVNWNKNIPGLLSAVSTLPKDVQLVLTGNAFTDRNLPEAKEIGRLIAATGLQSRVIRTGYVENKELSVLYSSARLTVLPSYYEGFGLPVLESMQCGCPVVIADTSSLKEIGGPAIRIHPEDPASITEGIIQVLTLPPATRTKLIRDGHEWVSGFTWKKTAAQTVEAYEKALGHHTGI